MIEAGDINDNQILNATAQRTDARGLVRFLYTLPSGRLLCSEWIAEDNKKAALRKWVEVVREQIVADATAERRVKAKLSTPVTTGTEPSSASTTQSSGTAVADTTLPVVSDPLELAQKMFDRLDSELADVYNAREALNARAHKLGAERDRWLRVINVLKESV